ncbi:hypothetical protein GCM10009802_33070 [Streptomyces synnematoformans]|uniref:Uncharacterized protein n=1 Tax=Streptomyces synnematoformans TaxID=415721 RepID=A0ABP5K5D0_9ACTN
MPYVVWWQGLLAGGADTGPAPQDVLEGVEVLMGRLPWASPAVSGAVHDLRAGREHGIISTLAAIRALVEQAVATLKSWRLLRRLRCSTARICRPPGGDR